MNREIPQEALDDLSEHIEKCGDCRNYLDENLNLRGIISLYGTKESNEEFFARIEDELNEKDIRVPFWETIICSPHFRTIGAVAAVFVFAFVSAIAIYAFSMDSSKSLSDKKFEAMMKKMPEGAVMMRTPDGEEVIFLDPALDADQSGDDVMRELKEVLKKEPNQPNEDFEFASSD